MLFYHNLHQVSLVETIFFCYSRNRSSAPIINSKLNKMKIKKFFRDFKKIGVKQKLAIVGLLFFCFLLGFGLAVLFLGRIYQSQSKAQLSLITPKLKLQKEEKIQVVLFLSSPKTGIEAADFVVDFDSNYLKINEVSLGNFFNKYPVKRIKHNSVKISGVASFSNNKITIPKGEGNIATFTFTAINSTKNTQIIINRKETIVANGGKNILGKTNNLDISVQ